MNPTVYIVEDDVFIAMLIADILGTFGYSVLGISGKGEDALGEIHRLAPQVVLLDVRLAGRLTGVDLARHLVQTASPPAIVFLTAYRDEALLRELGAVEPSGYLMKPFREAELQSAVLVAYHARNAARERDLRLEENRQLETRLAQCRRDQSLARLAGGVAHQFSNIAGSALVLIEMAVESIRTPDECEQVLLEAIEAVRRLSDISRQLRNYANGGMAARSTVNLARELREMSQLLQAHVPDGVALRLDLGGDGPELMADASALRDAMVQLVDNACEAMADGGGTVEVSLEYLSAEEAARLAVWPAIWSVQEGGCASLTVRDDGQGVAVDDIREIFEPFFSTRRAGRGLGLSTVASAARVHGGAVGVETGPLGSVFRLFLPLAGNAAGSAATKTGEAP